MNLLYDIAYFHNDPDSVLLFAEELIKLSTINKNSLYLHKGLLQKGNALRLKGMLNEAIQAYFESANQAKIAESDRALGCTFQTLGDVYFSAGDTKNSLKYYNKAYVVFSEIKDSNLLANVMHNFGNIFYQVGKADSALKYFDTSYSLYYSLKNTSGIAYSIGNKGLALLELKEYKEAEKNLLSAIAKLEESQDIYPIARYLVGLTTIYKDKGDLKKAILTAEKSYNLATMYGFNQQTRDACEILSELHKSAGDYKKAFKYLVEFIIYRDSVVNREKLLQMADLRTEYEVSQKQIEVDLLKKKRESQAIITLGLGIIIFLAFVFLCILYRHNKNNKKLSRQLAEQKEELETQRDQLVELNNTKDKFFSIISHDLRGPVNNMHGFSILVKELIQNNNTEGLLELSEELNISVGNVSSLLDNLLVWALSQQGRFPYSPEKLQLTDIFDDTVMSSSPMALAKNISIVNNTEKNLEIWADRNSIMTVLRNLLNNALKFSHPNSIVEITAKKVKKQAEIRVIDFGVGIHEDKLADIFRFKKDKSTYGTAREKGVGLGLSLSHDFVTMNKGTISVKSKPGAGTTFTVTLPLSEPD